jgi:hypothetical protein
VSIPAGVIGVSFGATMIAHVYVAAQVGSAADFNGAHGTMLLKRHGSAVDLPILHATFPEDVGHFQGRPGHLCTGGSGRFVSDSKGLWVAQIVSLET